MKKLFKSVFSALLAVCTLTLCSCGSSGNSSSSQSSDIDELNPVFTVDPEQEELGEYTPSKKGTMLYYSPDEVSPQLMLALEKYFISFSQSDYDSYAECLYPDYITEMNKFLDADYGYDLKQSFQNQCESLESKAGGKFTVTRLKAELSPESICDEYFANLDDTFGSGFYDKVKKDVDSFHELTFFVMSKSEENGEMMLISEFEIVFAEKDGKFYTFG